MVEWFTSPHTWMALATLTSLEVVLGVDNVIFISILASKLPRSRQSRARRIGLSLAMFMRIALLASLAWMIQLTRPFVTVVGFPLSGRDVILLLGGLFLLAKSTYEIHDKLEGPDGHPSASGAASLAGVLVQIVLLDIVFSLDSVITAVGMANDLAVMIVAVVLAVIVMMVSADGISAFVEKHPTVKMLALSFLLLIGVSLMADGLHHHIPKGYIYFAMAFSVFVEMINVRVRAKANPAQLQQS